MRLIDADAMRLIPADQMRGTLLWGRGNGKTTRQTAYILQQYIDSQPTIDAAPVVHARWETSSDDPDRLICSACGRRYDMYHFDQKDMPYCLCGAKMDGGENDGSDS